jgi:hypothetical protein
MSIQDSIVALYVLRSCLSFVEYVMAKASYEKAVLRDTVMVAEDTRLFLKRKWGVRNDTRKRNRIATASSSNNQGST